MNDFRSINRYQLLEFLEQYNREYGIHPDEQSMNFVINKHLLRKNVSKKLADLSTRGMNQDLKTKLNINNIDEFQNEISKMSTDQLQELETILNIF